MIITRCRVCNCKLKSGDICPRCEREQEWLNAPEYFCTSSLCGKFLPGATEPGLCDACKKFAQIPYKPLKKPTKIEEKPETKPEIQEEIAVEKTEKCSDCKAPITARRKSQSGLCERCFGRQWARKRAQAKADSKTTPAPAHKTGAKTPMIKTDSFQPSSEACFKCGTTTPLDLLKSTPCDGLICPSCSDKMLNSKTIIKTGLAKNATSGQSDDKQVDAVNKPEAFSDCAKCGATTPIRLLKTSKRVCPTCAGEFDKPSITIAELPMSLLELQRLAHENAINKGWHETPRSDGEMIALMHSELSEALEELRNGKMPTEVYFKDQKPEGVPIELADVVIRIFDFCGLHKINLQSAIVTKMVYNQSRPHRHGGKKL